MINLDGIVERCFERKMTVILIGALGEPHSKERWKQNERLREESESPSSGIVAKAFGRASTVLFILKKVTQLVLLRYYNSYIRNSNWSIKKLINNKFVCKVPAKALLNIIINYYARNNVLIFFLFLWSNFLYLYNITI